MKMQRLENPFLLKHAFEHAALGVVLFKPDGTIIKTNQTFCDYLGYRNKELVDKQLQYFAHPDDIKLIKQTLATLLADEKEALKIDYRLFRQDKSIIWISSSTTLVKDKYDIPLYFVGHFYDITEQKRVKKELINSERRYKQIINETPDTVLIIRDKRCLFINQTGVELIGAKNRDEVIGQSVLSYMDGDTLRRLRYLKDIEIFQTPFGPIEGTVIREDGKRVSVEIKSIPTVYHGLKAVHAIVTDISERKQTRELMMNTEKLTTAGQLAAGIVHEIKNPLTTIKGFIQLMENSITDKQEYFPVVLQEINRMETFLKELLVLAKPQTDKIEEKEITTILHYVITLSKALPNSSNTIITTDFESNLPNINCNESQLKQVFINFIKNACEAMPDGGEIQIKVSKCDTSSIMIQIIDEGCGIPQHLHDKLGEPFLTTKETGTGLGLMISSKIIDAHNGTLQFRNGKKGTIVEVTLPYIQKEQKCPNLN